MIKLVMPMKRRPGMTVSEFREYYESRHRLIGEKYLRGHATRYVRRYLSPQTDRDGIQRDAEYDVILEIWYPSQSAFEQCASALSTPEAAAEIAADEAKLFDLSKMRSYLVEECESEL